MFTLTTHKYEADERMSVPGSNMTHTLKPVRGPRKTLTAYEALNVRERRFVDAYLGSSGGNATAAAKAAGYAKKTAEHQASRMLGKVGIRKVIEARSMRDANESIATAEERDAVLTAILREFTTAPMVRIRAIAELNKCTGRHSIKHVHGGALTLEQILGQSREGATD